LQALGAFAIGGLIPAVVWAADVVPVTMKKLVFTPLEVKAHVGDTVEWFNDDFLVHTATARDGAWDFMLPKGSKARIAVKTAGTIEYYCRLHPNMTGRIVVEP
jgi:plastocyanin